MRQATGGWTAKLLLGLLIVSFGIWGVAGRFGGYGSDRIASVGDQEVTAAKFDRTLRMRMQQLSQQMNRGVTMEQARSLGLPQQVLSELVAQAALNDQARAYNLGVSDDKLAAEIAADPNFQGLGGRFDRQRFQALLRNAGLREQDYISDIRHELVRQQMASAIASDLKAPQPLVEALYRYQNETRDVSFLTIDASAIEPVGEPDEEALKTFFVDNQSQFRAPEYRSIGLIDVDPKAIVDPASVPEEDVRQAYENEKSSFTVPEKRRVLQIRFQDQAAAEAAAAALDAGKSFEDIAAERGVAPADLDLGMKTRAEFIDAAVADAAFEAQSGETAKVFDSKLGPAIIKVAEVAPGSVQPFSEVEGTLRQEIAQRRGNDEVLSLYDKIEDERAAGSTLQEAANKLNLTYQTVQNVAADGTGMDGQKVEVAGGDAVINAAFQSDVGLENDPIRKSDGGYVFYDVEETTPARDRTLEEARSQAVAAWQADETAKRIRERASALFKEMEDGKSLADIAAEIGKTPETVSGIGRTAGSEPSAALGNNAVAQAFAGPQGHIADAEGKQEPNRVLLHVDSVSTPAYFAESASAQQLRQGLAQSLQSDLLQAFNAHLLDERPVSVNQSVYAQITGQSQPQ
ncbi:peptidylprolyl isomerase [Afifella sp. IM 167]|uniref:peptidylprolyl isomerase n=1 Tax=Afifella sp. IM 167 TaxID=2033586 RepID=UPI0021020A86|nr:peptidylprolyl isomerase [Afifella sp. IM 167]